MNVKLLLIDLDNDETKVIDNYRNVNMFDVITVDGHKGSYLVSSAMLEHSVAHKIPSSIENIQKYKEKYINQYNIAQPTVRFK